MLKYFKDRQIIAMQSFKKGYDKAKLKYTRIKNNEVSRIQKQAREIISAKNKIIKEQDKRVKEIEYLLSEYQHIFTHAKHISQVIEDRAEQELLKISDEYQSLQSVAGRLLAVSRQHEKKIIKVNDKIESYNLKKLQ